jgi:peroxiredoxin
MAESDDSRERKLAAKRAWYYANREKSIARATQWTKDNKEQSIITRRARYAIKRDKIIVDAQVWRANNPERAAYTTHKHHAKLRDVPFLLTFDEWCAIWRESGKFAERGHCVGQYVMARTGDKGPYAVGNVRIATVSDNHAEAWELKPDRHRHRRKLSHD